MGCHRSGTNLLYDMLMSAGGFAIYRGILPVYETLIPRFGSLKSRAHREKLVEKWLLSEGFRRTGLDAQQLSAQIVNDCRTGGDFIRIIMDGVAQNQQTQRWAAYDPDNVMHVERIKREIPNAIFLHIIRDGRDIALSLKKMGGFAPLPWDRTPAESLVATALYWQWMVHRGRFAGRKFPADYIEIRYEDLVTNPRKALDKLGSFIDHDLDYDRIQRAALGRVSDTNSSFREEGSQREINPLGRWRERLSHEDIAAIEATVGQTLQENGYELSLPAHELNQGMRLSSMRTIYPAFLNGKQWLKAHTPLGRFARVSVLKLEEEPLQPVESIRS
jgi:hypothetical protein